MMNFNTHNLLTGEEIQWVQPVTLRNKQLYTISFYQIIYLPNLLFRDIWEVKFNTEKPCFIIHVHVPLSEEWNSYSAIHVPV